MTKIGVGNNLISPQTVTRIFLQMKMNPLKVYTSTELGINKAHKSHLTLLKKLGIIEEVDYFYNTTNRDGTICRRRAGMKGWRLK